MINIINLLLHHFSLQIVLEGVKGSGFKGDIALDDISLNNALCPPTGKIFLIFLYLKLRCIKIPIEPLQFYRIYLLNRQ